MSTPDFLFRAIVVLALALIALAFAAPSGSMYGFFRDQGTTIGAFATFAAVGVALFTTVVNRSEAERTRRREYAREGLKAGRLFAGSVSNVIQAVEEARRTRQPLGSSPGYTGEHEARQSFPSPPLDQPLRSSVPHVISSRGIVQTAA